MTNRFIEIRHLGYIGETLLVTKCNNIHEINKFIKNNRRF